MMLSIGSLPEGVQRDLDQRRRQDQLTMRRIAMIRSGWLNTSVEDLRSTLACQHASGLLASSLAALRDTAEEAHRRGQTTREKVLRSFIRRVEKAVGKRGGQ